MTQRDDPAEYFLPVAGEVLGPRLAEHGLSFTGVRPGTTGVWASAALFFDVGYDVIPGPGYTLLLGLGLLERGSIGVWSLAPPHEASELAWQFDTAETLRSELERAWKETVAPYAVPLFYDHPELARRCAAWLAGAEQEREARMESRLLRLARAKFKEGEFAAAIAAYDELPAARLARSDALRVDIALRRMQDPG